MHDAEHLDDQTNTVRQRVRGLRLGILIFQIGIVVFVIMFAALFSGLWIDERLGAEGLCTVGAVVFSVPVNLYIVLRIALGAAKREQFFTVEMVSSDGGEEVDS